MQSANNTSNKVPEWIDLNVNESTSIHFLNLSITSSWSLQCS